MEFIKRSLLLLFIPTLLFGAQTIGDTLWVARSIAPDRTAHMVFKRPFSVKYSADGKKFTLSCAAIVRDSTGKLVTLKYRPRWIGVTNSTHQIVYTTADTLKSDWEPGLRSLSADGNFQAKE